MLEAGGDGAGTAEILALETADGGGAEDGRGEGRFAKRLRNAAPAGVDAVVHHRGERPVDAVRLGFGGGHRAALFDERRIPRAGLGERDGCDGAVAVNHVGGEERGDAETRLGDGALLERVARGEQGFRRAADDEGAVGGAKLVGARGEVVGVRVPDAALVELVDFFPERHAAEEVGDAPVNRQIGAAVGRRVRGHGGRGRRADGAGHRHGEGQRGQTTHHSSISMRLPSGRKSAASTEPATRRPPVR